MPTVAIPEIAILFVFILSVAATPVNADPSPLYDVAVITPVTLIPLPSIVVALPTCIVVAVTTPTALIPPARTLTPNRAVTTPTESILVTSS